MLLVPWQLVLWQLVPLQLASMALVPLQLAPMATDPMAAGPMAFWSHGSWSHGTDSKRQKLPKCLLLLSSISPLSESSIPGEQQCHPQWTGLTAVGVIVIKIIPSGIPRDLSPS